MIHSNPNIQTESTQKPKRTHSNPEHKLQAECVKQFGQKYPEKRGALIAYFAETESGRDGALKVALGLVADISDLLYFPNREMWGIELKFPGTRHNTQHLRDQASWLLSFPKIGFFCDSVEMFWQIIETGKGGISPVRILENLKDVKTSSVSWEVAKK